MSDSPRMVYLPGETPTLAELQARAAARFPEAKVTKGDGELRVTFGDWTARVVDYRESWVAIEAKEIAERAPAKEAAAMAGSARRLEIYGSGDPDRDDDYFNEGLILWETFVAVPGAVGFDPVAGIFHMVDATPATRTATKRAAPVKKAATKKAAPKQTTTKKAATNKAATKKVATKKAATRKTVTKRPR